MPSIGAALLTLLLAQAVGGAQAPAPFPTGQDPSEGAARIEGVVTRSGTGEPIPFATVQLVQVPNLNDIDINDLTSLAADAAELDATTDAGGRFVIEGLSPGSYTITVFRDGFVRQTPGASEPGAPGEPVALTAGETFEASIQMIPAAVITGRIIDDLGRPIPRAEVSAMQHRTGLDGHEALQVVRAATTDDRGEYRLFWLTPGEYLVSGRVEARPPTGGLTITRTGAFITDLNAQPRNEEMAGFFPGVPDEALAAPVRVSAGEERVGVDIRLAVKATFTVSGRVVSPGPTGGFGMVSLRPDAPGTTNIASFLGNTGIVDSQGNFAIRNVEPGDYTLEARSEGLGGRDFRASIRVEVTNADVENITLLVSAGTDVAINAFIEDAASPAASETVSEFDWSTVRLMLATEGIAGSETGTRIDTEGGFLVENVAPGEYTLNVLMLPNPGIYVKSILVGAQEIGPDGRIPIDTGFTGPVSVLISPNGGRIDGVASTRDGDPAANAAVTLLPADMPDTAGNPMSALQGLGQNIRQTNADGSYSLSGIAPGEYRLFAWEAADSAPFMNPEIRRRFEARGERVVIREGDALNLNVEVIADSELR